jgi:hypothetical protein
MKVEPAVAERAGPRARSLAPGHRLPRPPRLHPDWRAVVSLPLHLQPRHGPGLIWRRGQHHRAHPRLAPRAQPLRAPLRHRPGRAHPFLVACLPRHPRHSVLLLAAHTRPGQAPRPGERPPDADTRTTTPRSPSSSSRAGCMHLMLEINRARFLPCTTSSSVSTLGSVALGCCSFRGDGDWANSG